ncbi:unnamed protein product [Nippostrongylus brasiliensis]|uniref:Uncharacterized protein n=1 Tax=Nippostrongylus brasiliensis TaxID=27835 RepID=A0A0N4XLC6_NIPBR|nr:unnamed protein product [Nippostrongylus brasiliensis]
MSAEGETPKFVKVDTLKLLAACRFQGRLVSVDHHKITKLIEEGIKHAVRSADRAKQENKELRKEIEQLRAERAKVVVIADSDDVTSSDERPPEPSNKDEEAILKKRRRQEPAADCDIKEQ